MIYAKQRRQHREKTSDLIILDKTVRFPAGNTLNMPSLHADFKPERKV